MTAVRSRLSPDDRRAQLLDVGAALFAAQPYEAVLMEQVAHLAGVSRALVYRYFPSKRDLFAAIFRRDSARLLAAAGSSADLPPADRVTAGLDAHIDYFARNPHAALAVNRGPLSGDPLIQGIIADELAEVRRTMLDAAHLEGHARRVASTALHGWLLFVRGVCTEWIEHQTITRAELRDMCLRTLLTAVGAPPAGGGPFPEMFGEDVKKGAVAPTGG